MKKSHLLKDDEKGFINHPQAPKYGRYKTVYNTGLVLKKLTISYPIKMTGI